MKKVIMGMPGDSGHFCPVCSVGIEKNDGHLPSDGCLFCGTAPEGEKEATMKIVVAGPPHSGKSVFLGGLCENLPRNSRYLFRACPDGEGTWLQQNYDREEVVALRRKGKFSTEVVDWYCESLASCEMAPIVLVDIGGVPSAENRRILSEGGVNFGIILAGNKEAIPEWERFLVECGVEVIAVVHSDYSGKEDSIQQLSPRLEGSVHHLDRGDKMVGNRPMIQAVANQILALAGTGEKEMELLNGGKLTVAAVAVALGKEETEKVLPGGRNVKQINWESGDLVAIADLLHNRSSEFPEVVDIDGPGPAWLHTALVHEVHPREARLNSPDGFIAIGCQRPAGDGAGVQQWTRTEVAVAGNGRKVCKVEFQLDPSVPFSAEPLKDVVPPEVQMGDVVVISGRGPNWLVASIAMAYHGRSAACATFQPGTGATVAWTHVQDVPLGSVIPV
jgi:CRISPR-associated Csx3 family protein